MQLVKWWHGTIGGITSGTPQCWGQFEVQYKTDKVGVGYNDTLLHLRCTRCGHKTELYESVINYTYSQRPRRARRDEFVKWAE